MKLIINTSSLFSGGGVQVALSFIEECLKFPDHEYSVFLCPALKKQVVIGNYPNNFKFYFIERDKNPIKNISYLKKHLSSLEDEIKPDVVFTVFGPSYWTPKVPHLLGYAIPHYLYSDLPFFSQISIKEKLFLTIKKRIQFNFFRKNAHFYHVETEDVRNRLSKELSVNKDNIFVVSNTFNDYFNQTVSTSQKILQDKPNSVRFRFLLLSAYYKHKNLTILNDVIKLLISREILDVQFVTTIPESVYNDIFTEEAKKYIYNIGFVPSKDCPQLYSECDFLFLPTLLECFSANYPEAMKMQKPILTSNYSFAYTICKDAALYFDPLDPKDVCDKIEQIINDEKLQEQLVANGSDVLKSFPDSYTRAQKYLEICQNIK